MNTVDFKQPRALWKTVWNDQQREAYVQNVAGHFGGVKSAKVRDRQCMSFACSKFCVSDCPLVSVWAAVDPELSNRIAKAIGASPVEPLKVKPASEALRFRHHVGLTPSLNLKFRL